ncbi:FMN-dependent NADH-azoreductase [Streptomyces jeddahensis]|uniref:FMN-dependent NADH-azoreductase 1 n=1 Tax=Streptomyces jeddahensis TaxID=1716141 RepID=A0A177HW83_9ACTN|nr:NAD(P)H-dependent oxidoreductase [Streptomyces jeddahensis]OAH15171.1 FMN-dependent NADH-azoreductase 1 [Streptomyces jeddahensis]
MATLLHIESSVFPSGASASRAVTETFRKTWEEQHPEGTVIYRDLSVDPVPHITADAHTAGFADPHGRTPEQAAAFAERVRLVEELEQADAVLIGAPMYNYAIPSTLKAWLDNVILFGRTSGETPSAVQNYLTATLADMLDLDIDFIVPELTMAPHNPAMAELIPLFEASRDRALEDAATKAKALAEGLAA